jgi:exosome complex RNA-binding protein Csl4
MTAPLAALALALAGTACGGNSLGTLGDIIGASSAPAGNAQSQLTAEVRSVDSQRQRIELRTQQGETGWVQYDQNTAVVYRQQQYPVTALERGDVVVLQVQESAQGGAYVSRIEVQQSVQERSGTTGGTGADLVQISGRIGQIDHDRGLFVLQGQNGNVTVSLPYNAPQATVDYFRRLRTGDSVRLEAAPLGSGRMEIYRFL